MNRSKGQNLCRVFVFMQILDITYSVFSVYIRIQCQYDPYLCSDNTPKLPEQYQRTKSDVFSYYSNYCT